MHPANEKMFLVLLRNMRATIDSMEQALLAHVEDAPAAKKRTAEDSLFTTPEEDEAIARAFGLTGGTTEQETLLREMFKEIREDSGLDQV